MSGWLLKNEHKFHIWTRGLLACGAALLYSGLQVEVRQIVFTVWTCGGVQLNGELHATATLIPHEKPHIESKPTAQRQTLRFACF